MSTSVSPRSTAVHPTRQQLDELDALLQRMLDLPVNQLDEGEAAEEPEPPAPAFRPPVSYSVPVVDPPARLEPRVVPAEEQQAPAPPALPPTPPAPEPLPPVVAAQEPGPDDWVRLASTWQPSAQTWQPLAQSWQAARPGTRPAPPVPAPPERVAETHPATPVAPARRVVAARQAPVAPPVQVAEPVAEPEDVFVAVELEPAPPKNVPAARAKYSWWQWPFVPVNVVFDLATLPLGPLGAGLRSRVGRNLLAALGIIGLVAAAVIALADEIGWIW